MLASIVRCTECIEKAAALERQRLEMETRQVAFDDRVATLEMANTELGRLLAKERHLTAAVLPEERREEECEDTAPTQPGCATCARYLQAVHAVRRDNAQEHRWVEHFQKTSHGLQTQLQERLQKTEMELSALQSKYEKLRQRKDDPLCRDTEIQRLRAQALDALQDRANANRTALSANKEAETLLAQLNDAAHRIQTLEIELREAQGRIRQHEDTIDAYRQAPALKDCSVGRCADYRCRKRDLELLSGQSEASRRIEALQKTNCELEERIKKCRIELYECQQRVDKATSCDPVTGLVIQPVFQIIEQRSKPLTANLEGLDDLKLNLKSFFLIFPNHDEEWEQGAMFTDFLLDLPPCDRESNLCWMYSACYNGRTLPDTDRDRFRQRSTPECPDNTTCRACFAACILAIGGNFRKHGSRTVWVNVRASRVPVFRR